MRQSTTASREERDANFPPHGALKRPTYLIVQSSADSTVSSALLVEEGHEVCLRTTAIVLNGLGASTGEELDGRESGNFIALLDRRVGSVISVEVGNDALSKDEITVNIGSRLGPEGED